MILQPATVDTMLKIHYPGINEFGLGWGSYKYGYPSGDTLTYYYHRGWGGSGINTLIDMGYEENSGLILFFNRDSWSVQQPLWNALWDYLFEIITST